MDGSKGHPDSCTPVALNEIALGVHTNVGQGHVKALCGSAQHNPSIRSRPPYSALSYSVLHASQRDCLAPCESRFHSSR